MLLVIIVWITAHLGRNPMNGGKPPSDSEDMNSRYLADLFPFVSNDWLIKDMLNILAMMVTVVVSNE
jgi:hypothetical protein